MVKARQEAERADADRLVEEVAHPFVISVVARRIDPRGETAVEGTVQRRRAHAADLRADAGERGLVRAAGHPGRDRVAHDGPDPEGGRAHVVRLPIPAGQHDAVLLELVHHADDARPGLFALGLHLNLVIRSRTVFHGDVHRPVDVARAGQHGHRHRFAGFVRPRAQRPANQQRRRNGDAESPLDENHPDHVRPSFHVTFPSQHDYTKGLHDIQHIPSCQSRIS